MPSPMFLRLAAVGTAAGVFSGLFGVGGGAVMVPLLILWLGYAEREAAGTSLAAIVLIAGLAAAGQALYGNVDLLKGLMIGGPATAGILVGAALQQRIPQRAVSVLLALVLIAIAADMLL